MAASVWCSCPYPQADRGSCRPFRASGCGVDPGTAQFFVDNVVDILVGNRDMCFAVPQTPFIDRVVDIPVVRARLVHTVQTVQKTANESTGSAVRG